jgi:GT2 family glycosyltransferase
VSKIGVGVITCNRVDFLKKCIDSIPLHKIDEHVIINDGDRFPVEFTDDNRKILIIEHITNAGVGKSKNDALEYLLSKDCDHIFLIEDDIIIKDENVFDEYIKASKVTGIGHFMFGYHGPANKAGISKGKPKPRKTIEYPDDIRINLNQHCVGAFCYYSKEALEDVGLMDEAYTNAFEHVDHSYMLSKAGYCTPYWWWPDIANSTDYLDELACSEESSSIKPREDWMINIREAAKYFTQKHHYSPAWQNAVPDVTLTDVILFLREKKT